MTSRWRRERERERERNELLKILKFQKKMFNQDEEKMECAVGNREMGFGSARKPRLF